MIFVVPLLASRNESRVELHRVVIDVRGNIVLGPDNYYEQEPQQDVFKF